MRFAGWQSRRRGNPCGCPHGNPCGCPHGNPCGCPHGNPCGCPHRNPCGCPHRNPCGNPHGNPHGGACESVSEPTQAQSLIFSSDYHTFDVVMEPRQAQPNTNEVCYVLVGQRRDHIWVGQLRKRREGSPTSVEFDWGWVMVREESFGDVIGFYHTHPTGKPEPSRDVRTMQAWVDCFGKALLCVIESRGNPRACPTLAGYVFEQDSSGVPVARISRARGNVLVAIE